MACSHKSYVSFAFSLWLVEGTRKAVLDVTRLTWATKSGSDYSTRAFEPPFVFCQITSRVKHAMYQRNYQLRSSERKTYCTGFCAALAVRAVIMQVITQAAMVKETADCILLLLIYSVVDSYGSSAIC